MRRCRTLPISEDIRGARAPRRLKNDFSCPPRDGVSSRMPVPITSCRRWSRSLPRVVTSRRPPKTMRAVATRNTATGTSITISHLDLDDLSNPHEAYRLENDGADEHHL